MKLSGRMLLFCSGFACGPALAGVIGDHYGLSAPFFLCGAGMSIAAGSALVFLPETKRRAERTTEEFPRHLVSSERATTMAKKGMGAVEATNEEAVWRTWAKLLRVPNLQAVYVRTI